MQGLSRPLPSSPPPPLTHTFSPPHTHRLPHPTHTLDFTIAILTDPLTLGTNVEPICLPDGSNTEGPGRNVNASGWGTTSSGGSLANALQTVEKQIDVGCGGRFIYRPCFVCQDCVLYSRECESWKDGLCPLLV